MIPSDEPDTAISTDFFTENAGQLRNEAVRFYSSGALSVGFTESTVLIHILDRVAADPQTLPGIDPEVGPLVLHEIAAPRRSVLVRLTFTGSNAVAPEGLQEAPHISNFFLGNAPSGWRTGVRSYREVRYDNLYEGIDLVYRLQDGWPKYDFVIGPGADPAMIRMAYQGVDGLRIDEGEIVIGTAVGDLREQAPVAFQDGREVECFFVPRGPLVVGFQCDAWDGSRTMVIDPLSYATYLGGIGVDWGYALAVDASGAALVTGSSHSADFPATPGAYDATFNGSTDAFVAKLDAAGAGLLYTTFLGGAAGDGAKGIAIDASGAAFVVGTTESTDFPATPGAFDTTLNGGADAFVVKLDATGAALLYATYLGGASDDGASGIDTDSFGNAFVTGSTESTDFPISPGAYDAYNSRTGCSFDAFIAKLDLVGTSLVYATFLGGSHCDIGTSIAVDASGAAFVTGYFFFGDFPTTSGAYDTTYNGLTDAFVAKLDAAGSRLLYATYLGGSRWDEGRSIAVDAFGNAFVSGGTASLDFPVTPSAYSTALSSGYYDAFVAKLDASGAGLLYATYLGGTGGDAASGIAIDPSGDAFVTGSTWSTDFPATPDAHDTSSNGGADAFVVKMDAAGIGLLHATYLGGGVNDAGLGIAVDDSDNVFIIGYTRSTDFPATPRAYDSTHGGGYDDAFVAKLAIVMATSGMSCLSQGYWKNHPASWPVSSLVLGTVTYDQSQLLAILDTAPRGDASVILAHQLIAAKLNLAAGSNPTAASSAITTGDGLLSAYAGPLPYDVKSATAAGQLMTAAAGTLDAYNNGLLSPPC